MHKSRLEAFSDGVIAIIRADGQDSLPAKAIGADRKGNASVALMWLIPDKRIESALQQQAPRP